MRTKLNLKIKTLSLISIFCFQGLFVFAQIGIGTKAIPPKTDLDIDGALSLREGTVLNLTEGIYNANINLGTSPYSFYKINGPTTTFSISGIIPQTGANGQIVVLQNNTNAIMVIAHNHNSSIAQNRIYVPGEHELLLRGRDGSVKLQYSSAQSKWIVIDKLNHIETWYRNGAILLDSLANTITTTDATLTRGSSVTVSIINSSSPPIPQSELDLLTIEYVEVRDGQLIVRILNNNPDTDTRPPFYSFVTCSIAYTVNRIQ